MLYGNNIDLGTRKSWKLKRKSGKSEPCLSALKYYLYYNRKNNLIFLKEILLKIKNESKSNKPK